MEEIAHALKVIAKMRHDIDGTMFFDAYREIRGHELEAEYVEDLFNTWQNDPITWAIQAKNELTPLLDALWRRMPIRGQEP